MPDFIVRVVATETFVVTVTDTDDAETAADLAVDWVENGNTDGIVSESMEVTADISDVEESA